jgi:flagellar motor switch/type III secretory pathway protein FliN
MDSALIPTRPLTATSEEAWALVDSLPVSLSVEVQLQRFNVRDLLLLEVGSIVETTESVAEAAPLLANGKRIGNGVFEVVGEFIGFRISDLGSRE